MILISVYFRPLLEMHYLLEMLQVTIKQVRSFQKFDIFIIGGDMNRRLGQEDPWPEEVFVGLNEHIQTSDTFICQRETVNGVYDRKQLYSTKRVNA